MKTKIMVRLPGKNFINILRVKGLSLSASCKRLCKNHKSSCIHLYDCIHLYFLTATLLSCMNCTFNKVPRSIVNDMYIFD